MNIDICVPALPESIADAIVISWHKQVGEQVQSGDNLVDLETDKVILEVPAPESGTLAEIKSTVGTIVKAAQVLGVLQPTSIGTTMGAWGVPTSIGSKNAIPEMGACGVPTSINSLEIPPKNAMASDSSLYEHADGGVGCPHIEDEDAIAVPSARHLIKELGLDPKQIRGSGRDGRILKSDVMTYLDEREHTSPRDELHAFEGNTSSHTVAAPVSEMWGHPTPQRPEQRVPMTRLRAKIAERLVQAQQTAAILTTFNEIDMQAVMDLRSRYKELFEQKQQVRLGFMAFFIKATVEALKHFPIINAAVDGSDIIYHGYYDIGVAISTPRGLVVPVLRDCDQLSLAGIERSIADFAAQAKNSSLNYEDLIGGTFSITNGGVFGSLLSTPILNPPQSAILGMHTIKDRPVVVDGKICIRPMMYAALSYDHRIIDGRDAVQFLVAIKEAIEDPARLLLQI